MVIKKILATGFILFIFMIGLSSEVHYFKGEKLIKCRVNLPDNYDKTKAYPLVVGLHGHGGSSEGFSSLWKHFKKRDFIYACPEGPYNVRFKNSKAQNTYAWLLSVNDRKLWEKGDMFLENYILNVVNELSSTYLISKKFLFGFSAGASSAYVVGIRNPEVFSGIAAVSGMLPMYKNYSFFTINHLKEGNKIPILIVHGKKDKSVKYKVGVKLHNVFKQYNYKVEFKSYNKGHVINKEVLDFVYKWMKNK